MGRLVVSQFVTLDGVIEDPGGVDGFDGGGWAFKFERGPAGDRFKQEELMAGGALLLGRATYEGFAAAWPSRTDEVGFADKINSMPKFVVSRTLQNPEWTNSRVLEGNLRTAVAGLKRDISGDILVHGSSQLVTALMEHELVDEYRLMVFPTVLGTGKRLFNGAVEAKPFDLVRMEPAGDVLILVYTPHAQTDN
jgi:dihydrofolate reductase